MRIKPTVDGYNDRSAGFQDYDGPPPAPGIYRVKLRRMGVGKISSGENEGAHRLILLLEIIDGKYKGAVIYHGLNVTEQGKAYVNFFLDALTDGTDRQKEALQKMFWRSSDGWNVEDKPIGKIGYQFVTIGKKFVPIGRTLNIQTKMGNDLSGEPRAEVAKFIVPSELSDEEEDEIERLQEGRPPSGDGLGEFAQATSSNPAPKEVAPEPEPEPEPTLEPEPVPVPDFEDDEDDPWS